MFLKEFRVLNYRSINDSGPISVARLTALLGRNESGKSNLLRALHSLNPVGGVKALNKNKDFPRHRRLEECKDKTKAVTSVWKLADNEICELQKIWPRATNVSLVETGRCYDDSRWVSFPEVSALGFDREAVEGKIREAVAAVSVLAAELADESMSKALRSAVQDFEKSMMPTAVQTKEGWASQAVTALRALREALASADQELTELQESHVSDLEKQAETITSDEERCKKARSWVVEKMPIFMFLEEYPELEGHQNIAEYLQRKNDGDETESDRNFAKMCKVAGLDPHKINDLMSQGEHETRNQLANRAGAIVTSEIRRLWRDRSLKIRFDIDAEHLNTFVSDPTATYDVEINLNERSRGFQWFFSFYMSFAADTKGGAAADAVLLLDEPGLYLHAKSQRDLLNHFEEDFHNQIIYTTHSPFMVPTHNLETVRTVSISEEHGTAVSNNLSGDSKTLFPLQAALGYDLAQSLFVGPNNLVVEGVTDFWVLSSISEYLSESGGIAIENGITITPCGGAQKIHYMVALLTSERLNVLVLLDREKNTVSTRDSLVKNLLLKDKSIIFVSEAFGDSAPEEADIEDLLNPDVYQKLVRECYASELKEVELLVNPEIPRIAKQFDEAFKTAGLQFNKTRPTRLLLEKMSKTPEEIMTPEVVERFNTLNRKINSSFKEI